MVRIRLAIWIKIPVKTKGYGADIVGTSLVKPVSNRMSTAVGKALIYPRFQPYGFRLIRGSA
jgi:hypothetical protein